LAEGITVHLLAVKPRPLVAGDFDQESGFVASPQPFTQPSPSFLVFDAFARTELAKALVNLLAKIEFRRDIFR
jgi:hypothetical protein